LFEKEQLLVHFQELCGLSAQKPFECVGTIEEVNLAIIETIRNHSKPLPFLLDHYLNSGVYTHYRNVDPSHQLVNFENDHFVNEPFLQILNSAIHD